MDKNSRTDGQGGQQPEKQVYRRGGAPAPQAPGFEDLAGPQGEDWARAEQVTQEPPGNLFEESPAELPAEPEARREPLPPGEADVPGEVADHVRQTMDGRARRAGQSAEQAQYAYSPESQAARSSESQAARSSESQAARSARRKKDRQALRRRKMIVALLVVLAVAVGVGGAFWAVNWLDNDMPNPFAGADETGDGGSVTIGVPGISSAQGGGSSAGGADGPNDTSGAEGALPGGEYLAGLTPNDYQAMPLPAEMRAMWISFLEWNEVDLSTEAAARQNIIQMFENSKSIGVNTVMVAVRPFSDALYETEFFPQSHLLAGTQGQNPGYDPLAVMIEEAHARGLRVEAWVNPYRVKHPTLGPEQWAENNPALRYPQAAKTVADGGVWLDPGSPDVMSLIVNGTAEIAAKYDVDGIHFDDYFYPESATDEFDAETHAAHGGGRPLAEWRRENINTMVRGVYAAVKTANPTASFGISVQGNNENNYTQMYADVKLWMANTNYADYVIPQLYWGFNYEKNTKTTAAFANKCAEWAGYPRHEAVKLYAGLGAYRIGRLEADGTRSGFGDGGDGDQAEWETGRNLADMVLHLRGVEGFSGYALFRYDFLFPTREDPVAASERQALAELQ